MLIMEPMSSGRGFHADPTAIHFPAGGPPSSPINPALLPYPSHTSIVPYGEPEDVIKQNGPSPAHSTFLTPEAAAAAQQMFAAQQRSLQQAGMPAFDPRGIPVPSLHVQRASTSSNAGELQQAFFANSPALTSPMTNGPHSPFELSHSLDLSFGGSHRGSRSGSIGDMTGTPTSAVPSSKRSSLMATQEPNDSMQSFGTYDQSFVSDDILSPSFHMKNQGLVGGGADAGSPSSLDKDAERIAAEKRQSSRFVYKLMKMVSDPESQHLICFNPTGTSVIVTNFDDFAKEVLPKHFKHSNFSSFIRQLNMYGFYKVNKTPRGQKTSIESQLWEFSHPKFIRGRTDLLEEIRRKALDSDHARVAEARDLQFNMSMGQYHFRQQLDAMQCRLDQTMEHNFQLREFALSLHKTLSAVLDFLKMSNGPNLALNIQLPSAEMIATPMMPVMLSPYAPDDSWGSMPMHGFGPPSPPLPHARPSIFVSEPHFGGISAGNAGRSAPGPGAPSHVAADLAASMASNGLNSPAMPPSPQHPNDGGVFSMAGLHSVSPFVSRQDTSNLSPNPDQQQQQQQRHSTSADFESTAAFQQFGHGPQQANTLSMASSSAGPSPRRVTASMPRRSQSVRRETEARRDSLPVFGEGLSSNLPMTAGFPTNFNAGAMPETPIRSGPGRTNPGLGMDMLGRGNPQIPSVLQPHSMPGTPIGPMAGFAVAPSGSLFASAVNTPLPPSPMPRTSMDTVFTFPPPASASHHNSAAYAAMASDTGLAISISNGQVSHSPHVGPIGSGMFVGPVLVGDGSQNQHDSTTMPPSAFPDALSQASAPPMMMPHPASVQTTSALGSSPDIDSSGRETETETEVEGPDSLFPGSSSSPSSSSSLSSSLPGPGRGKPMPSSSPSQPRNNNKAQRTNGKPTASTSTQHGRGLSLFNGVNCVVPIPLSSSSTCPSDPPPPSSVAGEAGMNQNEGIHDLTSLEQGIPSVLAPPPPPPSMPISLDPAAAAAGGGGGCGGKRKTPL